MRTTVCLAFALALLCAAGAVCESPNPLTASPGGVERSLAASACPTFSWAPVPQATGYELVVYRVGDDREEARVVMSHATAGAALSWSPSLDRCLEPGGRYAWSVRAIVGKGATGWSDPALFHVTASAGAGAASMELEEALAVVRRYLDQGAEASGQAMEDAGTKGKQRGAGRPAPPVAAPAQSTRSAQRTTAAAVQIEGGVEAAFFSGDGSGLSGVRLALQTLQIDTSGDYRSCALVVGGSIVCWGEYAYPSYLPPASIVYTQIGIGDYHTCALDDVGSVVCAGDNDNGQVSGAPDGAFVEITAGQDFSCARRADGSVTCWGLNDAGQTVPAGGPFSHIDAGFEHVCGILSADGSVACWGSNDDGKATPPPGAFTQVSAGYDHSCGVKTDDSVACWGDDFYGQSTPPAGSFSQVSAAIYEDHSCGVLKTDGSVVCWGYNSYGQGSPPAGTFSWVEAAEYYTCGLRTNGSVACWGENDYGQSWPPPPLW